MDIKWVLALHLVSSVPKNKQTKIFCRLGERGFTRPSSNRGSQPASSPQFCLRTSEVLDCFFPSERRTWDLPLWCLTLQQYLCSFGVAWFYISPSGHTYTNTATYCRQSWGVFMHLKARIGTRRAGFLLHCGWKTPALWGSVTAAFLYFLPVTSLAFLMYLHETSA